jgi:hypothetical protein
MKPVLIPFYNGGGGIPITAGLYLYLKKGTGQATSGTWLDQSGNGRDFTVIVTTAPTLTSGSFSWNANGYLTCTTNMQNQTTGTMYLRFRVNQRDATDQRTIMSYANAVGGNLAYRASSVSADAQLLIAGSLPAYPITSATPNSPNLTSQSFSVMLQANGTSSFAKFSAGDSSATYTTSQFGDQVRLAANHSGALPGFVTITEYAMYAALHNTTQAQQILNYMDTL